jgi:hypothetical protein
VSLRSLIAVMSAGALVVASGGYGEGCSPSSPAAPADAGKGDATEPSDTGSPDSSTGSDAPAGQDSTTDSASVDSSGSDAPIGADAPTGPDGGDSGAPTDAASEADGTSAKEAGVIDGGQDAGDGGLSCPEDLSSFAAAPGTLSSAGMPAFTGGSIQDGEYVATSYVGYLGGACNGGGSGSTCSSALVGGPARATLTFRDGILRLNGGGAFCYVGAYTLSADTIVFPTTASAYPYSMSSDGLTLSVEDLPGGSCSWTGGQCNSVGAFSLQ